MRRSGESGDTTKTERVKVAMQVPKGANISEWKEETRTPTPVTIMEEGPVEDETGRVYQDRTAADGGREEDTGMRQEREGKAEAQDKEWKRGIGSV